MKLSCGVIADLLPLYAEGLTGGESTALVEEHLADCPDCRRKLGELKQPGMKTDDGAGALRAVKKDIRIRRLQTALLAALLVFLPLFALFAHSTDKAALPYEEGLVRVESTENGRLALSVDGRVSGIDSELCTEPGSSGSTLLLQAWISPRQNARGKGLERGSFTLSTVPDRVIYGFGEEQTLLYGEPMNGGVQVLPRLALASYLLIAAALAAISGLLWLLLRHRRAAVVPRGLFFAAIAYPIGHLLVKGTRTLSFFLPRDLAFILIAAAAVWGLLALGRVFLKRKRAEKA